MTTPAITTTGLQSTLSLAVALGYQQLFISEPFDSALCTHALALETKTFATADPTIQDIISCDGRNLADQIVRQWRGAFSCEFLATSSELGWALAIAWGAASSSSSISASDAVWTITITATGGTYRILFDGKRTTPLAFGASAATIQAAVDAVVGSGKYVAAGSGPYTLTAAGSYASTDLHRPTLSTLKLTGGTATIAATTWGGPARKSYTLTQDTADQPPAITAVLGYSGGKAWQLADLVVDTLTVTLEDSGLYRVRVSFIWSGLYEQVASFSWPACTLADTLDVRDGAFLFASTDHHDAMKALEYTFNNRIQGKYINTSAFAQALLRQFPLGNTWTAEFEENVDASGSVYSLAVANGQDGTKGAVTVRVGSGADGATFANPEAATRIGSAAQTFGGTPAAGRVPVNITALKSDGTSTKPTSATLITTYTGGYLATA